MKKLFVIPLLLVYLIFSATLVIGNHFCAAEPDGISTAGNAKNCCSTTMAGNNCCFDSTRPCIITNDYNVSTTRTELSEVKLFALFQRIFPVEEGIDLGGIKTSMDDSVTIIHFSDVPIYLSNRVLII